MAERSREIMKVTIMRDDSGDSVRYRGLIDFADASYQTGKCSYAEGALDNAYIMAKRYCDWENPVYWANDKGE